MKIRRLGSTGRFYEFDDYDCAWCVAAERIFDRDPELDVGDMVHLENDQGIKRTVTFTDAEPVGDSHALQLECEPYVFFSG